MSYCSRSERFWFLSAKWNQTRGSFSIWYMRCVMNAPQGGRRMGPIAGTI